MSGRTEGEWKEQIKRFSCLKVAPRKKGTKEDTKMESEVFVSSRACRSVVCYLMALRTGLSLIVVRSGLPHSPKVVGRRNKVGQSLITSLPSTLIQLRLCNRWTRDSHLSRWWNHDDDLIFSHFTSIWVFHFNRSSKYAKHSCWCDVRDATRRDERKIMRDDEKDWNEREKRIKISWCGMRRKAFQHVDGTLISILISTSPLTINSRFDFFFLSFASLDIRFVSCFYVFSWDVRKFESNSIVVRKTTSSLDV